MTAAKGVPPTSRPRQHRHCTTIVTTRQGKMLRALNGNRDTPPKYSAFTPERKLAFLAALSYYLTYKTRAKQFNQAQLQDVYQKIRGRFNLPPEESSQVIREIESHAGLVVAAGHSRFEFSHLSLQEYLCAYYMSREVHAVHLREYLDAYPNPVAISVVLAAEPGLAFAALFLKGAMPPPDSSKAFLARLRLESPAFDSTAALGCAILLLFHEYSAHNVLLEHVLRMFELPGVRGAIRAVRHLEAAIDGGRLMAESSR